VFYTWKVNLLRRNWANVLWRHWRAWRRGDVGSYANLPDYIRKHAPGHSFVDIGCMWGVNGEYSFIAEEAGASSVTAVDVFGPTPEFEAKKRERKSSVRFMLGDATHPNTLAEIGVMDVVFCAGVLYHHPSPFDVLVALRRICGQTLILRTFAIPEVKGLPNAAVYFPMLKPEQRRLWDMSGLGVPRQVGITDGFEPDQGYGNFFWGLTPTCLVSLLETAGFRIESHAQEAFAQTLVCTPVAMPVEHRLPNESEARTMGAAISSAGIARPC
jgi:hypothetical protein